jgi:hypothetical protein
MPPLEEETPIVDEDNDGLAPLNEGAAILFQKIIESMKRHVSGRAVDLPQVSKSCRVSV